MKNIEIIINELLEIIEKSESNRGKCLNCVSMYAVCNGDAGATPCSTCEIEKEQLEGIERAKTLKEK